MKKTLAISGFVVAALAFAYHVSGHPMDFRVYHYGARGVFDGTRPVYGPASGLGWPMHYRYPPLFLLLFAPLAILPLGWAAATWVLAKMGVLAWLLAAMAKRGLKPMLLSILFITPYIVEEFRYGNAQFFVLALTIGSLLCVRRRPLLAAAAMGLGISVKVWPLFFLPYLAVRRDLKCVAYTLGVVILLALLPSLYFGLAGNVHLLGQWFEQESHTQLSESEIWFPNQSLRGVLMRYMTVIDYSQVPDSNYAQVNLAAVNPATVRLAWMILAGVLYAGFLVLVNRRRKTDGWLEQGLAFCLVALLQPFTQKYALVLLLWPALVAAQYLKNRETDILIYGATVLVLMQPLVPGAGAQRLLQVLGIDFAATFILATAFLVPCCNLKQDATVGVES